MAKWWQAPFNILRGDTNKRTPSSERPITLGEMLGAQNGSQSPGQAPMMSFAEQEKVFGSVAQLGPGLPAMVQPFGGDPRQSQYRPGHNIPSPPGENRPLTALDLRELSYANFLARRCIEVRKKEIIGLRWGIVSRSKNRSKAHEVQERLAPLIAEITAIFQYPLGYMVKENGKWVRKAIRTLNYAQWLDMLLEDQEVLDALTIYPETTMSGKLVSLRPIDGSTIKPLLTTAGTIPAPPFPAYEQWLYGRANAHFTADQLYYVPFNRRVNTPYGFSMVEQNLIQINKTLRYNLWVSAYFTDGSMPEGGFEAPEKYSKDQVITAEEYLNAKLSGNPRALRQLNIFPSGLKWVSLKPFTFDKDFDTAQIIETCLAFDVQPQELGILPAGSLGGKGAADGQDNVQERKTLKPRIRQIQDLFTSFIEQYFGTDELEFRFLDVDAGNDEDPARNQTRLFSGQTTLDALLEEEGMEPVGVSKPFIVVGNQVFGVEDLKKLGVADNTQNVSAPGNVVDQNNQSDGGDSTTKAAQTDHASALAFAQNQDNNQRTNTSDSVVNQADKKRKTHELELAFAKWFLDRFGSRAIHIGHANTAQAVATSMAYTANEITALKEMITGLKEQSYLVGINDVLAELGEPTVDMLTDLLKKHELAQDAQTSANEIADTFSKNVEETTARLIDAGIVGNALEKALVEWQSDRAKWKGLQIGATEVAHPFAIGTVDFVQKNALKIIGWNVTPETCACDRCLALVKANPWPISDGEILASTIPVHVNCVHGLQPILDKGNQTPILWRG